jgi:hypothetical protein
MFENFSKFFAVQKNIYAFIAALVILTGIFLLKRAGLYEGLEGKEESTSVKIPSKIVKKPLTSLHN